MLALGGKFRGLFVGEFIARQGTPFAANGVPSFTLLVIRQLA
jgi:hypothetical protein